MSNDFNHIPYVKSQLRELNKLHVVAGVFSNSQDSGGVNLQILAIANEFGTTIRPKNGEWLTIPSENAPANARARDIPGLFRPKNSKVLAVKDSTNEHGFKIMFYLMKEVIIPERSFIRESVVSDGKSKLNAVFNHDLPKILKGELSASEVASHIGEQMVKNIQHDITARMSPRNAPATVARKGRNDPLFDTGRLYNSIDYKVVSEYG